MKQGTVEYIVTCLCVNK